MHSVAAADELRAWEPRGLTEEKLSLFRDSRNGLLWGLWTFGAFLSQWCGVALLSRSISKGGGLWQPYPTETGL